MTRICPSWFFIPVLVAFAGCVSPNTTAENPAQSVKQTQKDPLPEIVKHYETQDIPRSETVKRFSQLAEAGDIRAKLWMARLYFKGRGGLAANVDRGQQIAVEVFPGVLKMAKKGDAEAAFLVGSACQEGLGVKRDFKAAAEWYAKAIEAGHVTALNNYGIMNLWGEGMEPDVAKARLCFNRAAELGSKLAAVNSAKCFDDGRDDTERLWQLRRHPLAHVIGMNKKQALAYLQEKKLISDTCAFTSELADDEQKLIFGSDGIVIVVNFNDRVTQVEGHAESEGFQQFRGGVPLELKWNLTSEDVKGALGFPDDFGDVAGDSAYGMAYRTENVFFAVMFHYDGERKVKLWRVYERWASAYKQNHPNQIEKRPPTVASN